MTASPLVSRDVLLELRYALAWTELELCTLRLARALKRFNPNQPRVPAGQPGGGQWTDGSGNGAASEVDSESQWRSRPDVQPIGGFEKEHLGMTVQDFVSAYCLGSIRSVLPGQFFGLTISELKRVAKTGDPAARRCLKVLGREEYRK